MSPIETATDRPFSRATKIASGVAAIVAAIVGIGTVWTMLELPVLATRAYVDGKDATIVSTVLELAADQRDRLKRSRDALIARVTAAKDQQTRADLQQLVDQANQDVADVEARIVALERMRGKP